MPIDILEAAGELPDHLPLWRYMKLSTLLLLLEGTSFWPSVATLRANDPLEGELHPEPPWVNSALNSRHGRLAADELDEWLLACSQDWERRHQELNKNNPQSNTAFFADHYQRELARRRAVWCWFASDIESAGMWSVYGHSGIAVGTTVGALKRALPDVRHYQMSRIRYADRRTSSDRYFNPEDQHDKPYIHRPHFIKGREYEHEREVRIVTVCNGHERGISIRNIDSDELIRVIILSPIWPTAEANAVAAELRRHNWKNAPVIKNSELLGSAPETYELHERMDIAFSQLGEYSEEGLPQLMKEL
jgi:hypothetical protein